MSVIVNLHIFLLVGCILLSFHPFLIPTPPTWRRIHHHQSLHPASLSTNFYMIRISRQPFNTDTITSSTNNINRTWHLWNVVHHRLAHCSVPIYAIFMRLCLRLDHTPFTIPFQFQTPSSCQWHPQNRNSIAQNHCSPCLCARAARPYMETPRRYRWDRSVQIDCWEYSKLQVIYVSCKSSKTMAKNIRWLGQGALHV